MTPLAARPDLLLQVHPDDRDKAATLSLGSPTSVRWVCEHGHVSSAAVRSRAKAGQGCAYCANRKVLAGFNDVVTRAPQLVSEWHPTKNEASPTDYTFGSPTKVWWRCAQGHEWQAQIRYRARPERPTGCPMCAGVRTHVPSGDGRFTIVDGKTLLSSCPDVLDWWHADNDLTPDLVYEADQKRAFRFTCPVGHTFTATPHQFLRRKRNRCHICSGRNVVPGLNTLDVTHPDLAVEWDPDNNPSPAAEVNWSNRATFHWVCPEGHSYRASLRGRAENGLGCCYCEGRETLAGFNDVATVYPLLTAEWDDDRDPATFYKHSRQHVDWKCSEGHRWRASIAERTTGGTGCPYCCGQKSVPGVNDLETLHAGLAAQWHPTKNGDRTPADVGPGSGLQVWWLAPGCGHEWKSPVRLRVDAGTGCSPCALGEAIPGVNDVGTTHPHIVAYLDIQRSPDVDLIRKKIGSGQRAAWTCPTCRHRWDDSIRSMARNTEPCPRCSGREPTPGVNDAATIHPHLVAEVDAEVHRSDLLTGLSPSNGMRISWKCALGHRWSVRLVDRVTHKTGCPDCAASRWTSDGEEELAAYVESIGFTVERAKRIGRRANYDIFIPALNTFIEYNGLYFHSEATGRDRRYHAEKLQAVKDVGGNLLTVWEDDWRYRPDTVKAFIAHKLGRAPHRRTYARKTIATTVDAALAGAFLDQHHIQGRGSGGLRFALVDSDNEVVALLLVRTEGNTAEIVRYATSHNVPGGFTKLLRYAEEHLRSNAPHITRFKTFSDNLISDGALYEASGFANDGQVPPDYTYFRGRGPRIHKFNMRQARFRNDPSLRFEEGRTERELAALNGYHRIWDAGKTRWVRTIER